MSNTEIEVKTVFEIEELYAKKTREEDCQIKNDKWIPFEKYQKEIKRLEDIIDEQAKENDKLVRYINDLGRGW
jgi:hypothetical protein